MTADTPAARLAKAAEKLRTLAQGCPSWPWTYDRDEEQVMAADGIAVADVFALSTGQIHLIGDYLRAMHPGVALLLADLLDGMAGAVKDEEVFGTNVAVVFRDELALADALLEER